MGASDSKPSMLPQQSQEVAAAPAGVSPTLAGAHFLAFLWARPRYLLGYALILAMAVVAAAAPLIVPHSPVDADAVAFLQPPSLLHLMGTDSAGLDVMSRVLYAPRIDLTIAILSTLFAAAVGSFLGAFAGIWEGRGGLRSPAASVIVRAFDVLQAFPTFALALVLVAAFGQGVRSIVIAIAVVNIPVYLRIMRAQALTIRAQPFVEAATIASASDFYIIRRHILPNALTPILAQMAIGSGTAILVTAGLSFIGAGVVTPTPEWGSMIAMGFQNVMTGQWWPSLFPGLALTLTMLGFNLIGPSIEAWADPRQRTRPSRRAWRAFLATRAVPVGP